MPPNDDSEARIKEFMDGMTALSEKTEVDLFSFPQFVPQQDGTFKFTVITQPMDKKTLAMKSPLSDEIIKG